MNINGCLDLIRYAKLCLYLDLRIDDPIHDLMNIKKFAPSLSNSPAGCLTASLESFSAENPPRPIPSPPNDTPFHMKPSKSVKADVHQTDR